RNSVLAALTIGLLALPAGCRQNGQAMPSEITLEHCLRQLADVSAFERPPIGSPGMISTYDRKGGNDDWADLRRMKSGDLYVLADLNGPGCVHRIWMTSVPADEWMFFFDGETTPRIRVSGANLFGKSAPFLPPLCDQVSNGSYSYMPLPYSKSLKICISAKAMPQGARPYFHINYETYPASAKVNTFSPALSPEESQMLERVKTAWRDVGATSLRAQDACTGRTNTLIASQQTWRWIDRTKTGRLATFWIRPVMPQNMSYAGRSQLLRALTLRFYWDGEKQPSVEVPLGDFFCNGLRPAEFASLPLACINGTYICRFPMSFQSGMRAELRNTSYLPISIEAGYDIQPVDPAEVPSYFHANWNQSTSTGNPYLVARMAGKGHLAGCYLAETGTDGSWNMFEGDEYIAVDGETIPSFHGTGLEDFFNGAWYYSDTFNLPLHGLVSKAPIRSTQYRFLLSDAIRFEKSLLFNWEFGTGNAGRGYMSSVAYWYQTQPRPAGTMLPQLSKMFPPADPLEPTALMGALFQLERVGAMNAAADFCFEYADKFKDNPWSAFAVLRGWAYREAVSGYGAVSNIYKAFAEQAANPALAEQARLLLWFHQSSTNALLGIHPFGRHQAYLDGAPVADVDGPFSLFTFPVGLPPGEHEITVELSPTHRDGQFSIFLRAHSTNILVDAAWEYSRKRPATWPGSADPGIDWKTIEEAAIYRMPCMAYWQFVPNAFINMQSHGLSRPWTGWAEGKESAFLRRKFIIRQ
ncbi:MAG: glycoside hydrolase family 172 protein, partial [bacterium]